MVGLLQDWMCQDCYTCPHSYKDKAPSSSQSNDCGTIQVMVRDELHNIQPIIKATVESAVKSAMSDSVCSKNDIKDVVKSYADVAQAAQKEMIEKAAVAQSSKSLVQSVVRQLDADKVEREKRKCNVVVLNAPEPRKEFSTEEKKTRNFVVVFWTSHLITLKCAGGQEKKMTNPSQNTIDHLLSS